ncbi:hypothetical protein [Flavicella sediminum]|uniref:hypothetical protein n=1 Tax=Flavicella sediminum TaxID=2585141 RepID=UPI001122F66F|nr:hypothetical protein [Flavicella sediminum]
MIIRTLEMSEMEVIEGGGCAAFLAGAIGLVIGGGGPVTWMGALVAWDNSDSCADQLRGE